MPQSISTRPFGNGLKTKKLSILLLTIIALEGYIVLSSEMIAIRLIVPYVGGGTDTLAIIISAVLLPLAFGYYQGGRFELGQQPNRRYLTIRRKLVGNLLTSMTFFLFGLSFLSISYFFVTAMDLGLQNRIFLTTAYAVTFLVAPVYMLGQTVPLISRYFERCDPAEFAAQILCLSTLGSFAGAIVTTLILMSFLGVHVTVVFNFCVLFMLLIFLARKKYTGPVVKGLLLTLLATALNAPPTLEALQIIKNNQYNTISFSDKDGERQIFINNNSSSKIGKNGEKHDYIEYIEKITIEDIPAEIFPIDILVVGAGGFTLGLEDDKNSYDFVDLDASLKDISETYLLPTKLGDNKTFIAQPARAHLFQSKKFYDLVVLDVFNGRSNTPSHLLTVEFFTQVRERLKPEAVVVANFITSPNFQSTFSRKLDNTFRQVFPNANRVSLHGQDLWNQASPNANNVIYSYVHPSSGQLWASGHGNYTDNLNNSDFDKPY